MTSSLEGPLDEAKSPPGPLDSPPAPTVPLRGAEAVTAAVYAPSGLHDTGAAQDHGPAEHRTESPPRASRLKVLARRKKTVVIGITGVVLIAVLAAVLVFTLRGSSGPSARYQALMVDDPATGQFLLVGGAALGANGVTPLSDMWDWTGTAWTKVPASLPQEVVKVLPFYQLVYDPGTRQLLLASLNNTWAWNGATWRAVSPGPAARGPVCLVAYDAATRQLVMVIGAQGTTEAWDGTRWVRQRDVASLPPANGAMVYDTATGQLLLEGLVAHGQGQTETLVWSGHSWQQLQPSQSPPYFPRVTAYDSATQQVVLFASVGQENETWSWSGDTWTRLHPTANMPPLGAAPMAYDQSTRQLLLFGGSSADSNVTYNDTWDWTGKTWVKVA